MKIFLRVLLVGLILFITGCFLSIDVFAQSEYSLSEVADHNSPDDCWMVINEKIYDLSKYLSSHDDNLDIRPWCGKDASKDYEDKAGRENTHSKKADDLLGQYYIGNVKNEIQPTLAEKSLDSSSTTRADNQNNIRVNPYNFFIPLLTTVTLYILSLKLLKRATHNFIWNSILLLGLIPSFVYGSIMVLAKQFTWFESLRYPQMLYHHVELSIVFGSACILHFLYRLRIYLAQASVVAKAKKN